ncbi:MAG: hypothetical protein ACK4SM_01575 [Aquificaceae bacterium]
MKVFLFLLLIDLSFSLEFCIKPVENPYNEPYVSYALLKNLERSILESGHSLGCKGSSVSITPVVKDIKEVPTAYTPFQRVSAYSMTLTLVLRDYKGEVSFSPTVPYDQSTGGLGNLPRREAIDNAMSIIYVELVENFKRRYKDADNGGE